MAKSVWRRFPAGRLAGGNLVKLRSDYKVQTIAVSFFESAATQTLTPSVFTNTQTFYAPTVYQPGGGTQALSPGLFSNTSTLFTPALAAGAVTLLPPALASTGTLFAPTVTRGAVTLSPGLLTNANTLYAATVTPGPVTLAPVLFTNTSSLFAPVVSPGAVTLSPPQLSSASSLFVPTVALAGGGAQTLSPGLLANTSVLYVPSVAAGSVTLTPALLTNTSALFAPMVLPGPVTVAPGLLTNTSTLFTPDVQVEGSYVLTYAQAKLLYQIYMLHGLLTGSPLSTSATQRAAGGISQSIADSGGIVTIQSNAVPNNVGADVGTMIEELAALHGLTATLSVSSTTRSAGFISQAISSTSGTTTVSRA